jgi:type I site-specific restriction endonuclease
MNINKLYPNQIKAIDETLSNDFSSGIHYHATGTGKSWIGMNIILEFYKIYPKLNIIWICEKKSILIEQFKIENLRDRDFNHIFQKYNILNFSENKLQNWYNSVNSGIYWNKPVLLIINRAFLTSGNKYKRLKLPFDLIIHDECHTIVNKTTRDFYDYILNKNIKLKCIGFSATPNLNYEPYKNIISSYSIYDGFIDNVIVPPKIKWFTCDDILHYDEIFYLIKKEIEQSDLPYKKIIVWCGMINLCINMAKLCSKYFEKYLICIDTSKNIEPL